MTFALITLLIAGITGDVPATSHAIHIERHAPTTQVVRFDPRHPPKEVSKLPQGEDALTRMLFNCTVRLKYLPVDERQTEAGWRVTARLEEVNFVLELKDTLYLPEQANDKLCAHEQGHARINALIYQDAERAAQSAGEQGLSHTWTGAGSDRAAAGKAATDAAVESICNAYLKQTASRAFRIGEIYDDLTSHGSNAKQEEDAIRQAIEKQRGDAAADNQP